MSANQANVILQAFKPLLIGLVTAGFVSGGLVILAVWLLISQFSAMSGFMAIVLITCALMSLLMAFRFYARISLQLAQNDQKHLQNALIQAKDMLDTSKQLRDDHVLLQSLLQNLPFPVWLKDRFGRYLVYNQAFVQQWCGGTDAKGKTDEELLNPQLAEAFKTSDQLALNSQQPQKLELKLELTDQPVRWVRIERYALIGDDNQALGVLGFSQDVSTYKDSSAHASDRNLDPLTGFASQSGLSHQIENTPALAQTRWCLNIDIDHFKVLNDSLGQESGDALLLEIAERIRQQSEDNDFIARPGADEFVLFWQESDRTDNEQRLSTLFEQLQQPITLGNSQYSTTCSIGVARSPDHGQSLKALRQNAGVALFNAKKHGRNQVHWYHTGYEGQANRRLDKNQLLHQAVKLNNFEVHVQPRINCRSGEIQALECLVRIPQADGQLLYPGAFIELAEQNGLIRQIDSYMLKYALRQLNDWLQQGIEPLPLAVNLSVQSINDALIELLSQWQMKNADVFEYLEIELTEHKLPENDDQFAETLANIREFNIRLALDDFGTGYANLSRLPELPFQMLKLDRSFITELPHSEKQQAVVKSVIDLCMTLGIQVIAEGIETEEELTVINDLGCSYIQGFVYAKPKIITNIEDWIAGKKLTEQ
ncbi:putative bifunctional diguanylate cyclase/phosphodiesterase [Reinekea marinisedimentorum]|uniref:Diguanylate cyclase (GGDEF)-like protein n=1 Tax=Reinekea marinisedimentorum TaxID=230495 RepID=A0A4R3HSK3_9GAMM|nr:GGDEF and EAL domain-containing protein [Reinekea marinisedimentorum]TCS35928.1 diguanylate cyclase (GGDEF)-like protein [Reinekea marinisedimentorum]